jgi:spermidine/putrescine transport system ATP-binding protein
MVQSGGTFSHGAQVTVAIRPEKLRLLPKPMGASHNSFPCQVEQVIYVGTDTRFLVRLSENVALTVREQNVISTPDPSAYYAEGGDQAYAVWLSDAGQLLTD